MLSMYPPTPSHFLTAVPAEELDSDNDASDMASVSTASFPPFSVPPSVASSLTSYDVSMRSPSPAPSVWSISSSMREHAYRQEYGRHLNNYSEVYRLPADDEELDRLDKQHLLFMEVMGKYPPGLQEVMADNVPGESKACLDLGCGSGSWIMDVARDFPNCSAVAVDLVPMQSITMPANCRSEVDDINLGLEHFYGDFNVVHARLICSGIKDFPNLIDQMSQTLRPRGLLDLMEFDFMVYGSNYQRMELDTSIVAAPWFPRWMNFLNVAVRNAGGSVDAANHLETWVKRHPMLEEAVYREFFVPTCPFNKSDPASVRHGNAMRDDILVFLKSGRPMLLKSGIPESIVDELELNAEAELLECRVPGYIRLQSIYARKRVSRPHH